MSAWAGQACLRLWIPSRFLLTTNGSDVIVRPTSDINEAASYVRVVAPLLEYAAVLVDAGTQDKAAVFMDEEVTYVGTERKAVKRAEISYLDPKRQTDKDAKTILRIVYSDARTPLRAELDLGGRLLMAQMDAASLLTDPVVRTQRQLNLLTTLVSRIAETAAFRERYTKNAKPQGSRIPYEEGDSISDGAFLERDEEGRTWQVIPEARTLGANTTTELVGLPQYDDRGDAKGNQMPDVVIVDPVDPKPYIAAADATRHRLLRMCAQGHLGGSSNAEVSGIAYEQARAVFEKDLNRRRVAEEGMLRDLLTAVLAMVEAITGKKGYFTDVLRVTVDQHINPGPRSPDLVRLDLEGFDAGVLSRETTMARLGVEDTTAEAARIRTSALYILSVIEQATKASLSEESFKQVLTELKLPAEIVDAIEFKVAPAPVVPPVEPDTSEIV